MSSALIVSFGCFLVTSLVLADLRRDFPNSSYNKGARPSQRRGTHSNQRNKGGNLRANRVYFPFSGKQGSAKAVDPYNTQPGYVTSKADSNVYSGYNQGNDPYVNKGGNAGAQGVTYPYNGNQGFPKVVNPYNNEVENVNGKPGNDAYGNQQGIDPYLVQGAKGGDVYKVGDPYVVTQGGFTAPGPYKNQPIVNGDYPKVKNGPELGQYSNQDNKGGNVGAYTVTSVYDGKQGGSLGTNPYNNQPGNIGGITNKDTYTNQPGNLGGITNKDTYTNQPGNFGGINSKDTYNSQQGNIGGVTNKDTYNNQPGNLGGITKDTYTNQPGDIGGITKDTYNNQPGNLGGITKDTYNNQPGNIGDTIDKDTYNKNNNIPGSTTVYNNAL